MNKNPTSNTKTENHKLSIKLRISRKQQWSWKILSEAVKRQKKGKECIVDSGIISLIPAWSFCGSPNFRPSLIAKDQDSLIEQSFTPIEQSSLPWV